MLDHIARIVVPPAEHIRPSVSGGRVYFEYEARDDPESLHLKSQADIAVWPTSVIIDLVWWMPLRVADISIVTIRNQLINSIGHARRRVQMASIVPAQMFRRTQPMLLPAFRCHSRLQFSRKSCIKSCHRPSVRSSSTSHNAASFRTPVPSALNGPPASARRYASTESPLSKTGLFDLHVANGGKMVPFAGYSMPVQYSGLSVGDSHRWTREKASLFDVGHMCVRLSKLLPRHSNLTLLITFYTGSNIASPVLARPLSSSNVHQHPS